MTHHSGSCGIPVVDPIHVRIVLADGIKLTVGGIELDFVCEENPPSPHPSPTRGDGVRGAEIVMAVVAMKGHDHLAVDIFGLGSTPGERPQGAREQVGFLSDGGRRE